MQKPSDYATQAEKHKQKKGPLVLLTAGLLVVGMNPVIPWLPENSELARRAFAASAATNPENKVAAVLGTDLLAFIENDQVLLKANNDQGKQETVLIGRPLCAGLNTKTGLTTIQCFFTGGDRIQSLTQARDKEMQTVLKLKTGTQIKGVVETCNSKSITIKTPELRDVPIDQIARIVSPYYCTITGQCNGDGKFVPVMMVSSTGSIYGNCPNGFGFLGWLNCQEPNLGMVENKQRILLPMYWQIFDSRRNSVSASVAVPFRPWNGIKSEAAKIAGEKETVGSPLDKELEHNLLDNPFSLMLGPVSLKLAIPPLLLQNKKEEKEKEKKDAKNIKDAKDSKEDKEPNKDGGGKAPDNPEQKRKGGKKVVIDGLPPVDEDLIVQMLIEQIKRMQPVPDPVPPKGGEGEKSGSDSSEGGKGQSDGSKNGGNKGDGSKNGGNKGDTGGSNPKPPVIRNWFLVQPPEVVRPPVDPGTVKLPGLPAITDLGYLLFANEYIRTINNQYDTEIPLAGISELYTNNGAFFPETTEPEINEASNTQQDMKQTTEMQASSEVGKISMSKPGSTGAGKGAVLSIEEAQRNGLCEISIRSNNDPNHCEVLVTSKSESSFTAQIAEKACFMSSNPQAGQNLMEATDPVFTVPAGQLVLVPIETFCISTKSIKPPPAKGMKYTAGPYPDQVVFKKLVRIAQTAEKLAKDGGYNNVPVSPEKRARKIAQTAIWMYLGKRDGKKSELVTSSSIKEDLLASGTMAREKLTKEQLQRVDIFAGAIYEAARKTIERAE